MILSTKGGWGGGKEKNVVYEGRKGRARGFIMMAKLSALGGYVLFATRGRRQTWGGWLAGCGVPRKDRPHGGSKVQYKSTYLTRSNPRKPKGTHAHPLEKSTTVQRSRGTCQPQIPPVDDDNDWTSTGFDSTTVLKQRETKRGADRPGQPDNQLLVCIPYIVWDEDHQLRPHPGGSHYYQECCVL